jgi:hypothetical protein
MGCCPSFHGIDVLPHTGTSEARASEARVSEARVTDRSERIENDRSESDRSEIELSDPAPDFDRMLEEAEKKRPKRSPKFSLRRQNRMVFE